MVEPSGEEGFVGIQMLIFDLDGTLLDSRDLAVEAVREGCRQAFLEAGHSRSVPGADAILEQVGQPSPDFHDNLLRGAPCAIIRRAEALCCSLELAMIRQGRVRLFDGVWKTLSVLHRRGYRLAIASNCSLPYLSAVVDHCDLDALLDVTLCVGHRTGSTKADLVREIISGPLGARLPAVLIGDRSSDAEAAMASGLPFVGCSYGFGRPSELESATCTLDSPARLLALFPPV